MSGDSVSEGWQVGSGEASYFRRYVSDFQRLVSVGEGDHGEIVTHVFGLYLPTQPIY